MTGGVPDADDTPGALLALKHLDDGSDGIRDAARFAVKWLLDLQNRDGGIPTFCKGWANLPFDRSSNDLTAHTLRAWRAWEDICNSELQKRIRAARAKSLAYLARQQREDGAWLPLWFGNQHNPEEENPVYGTSRVLLALITERQSANSDKLIQRGMNYLIGCQNKDGGWGGSKGCPSSIEETALVVDSIAAVMWHANGLFEKAKLRTLLQSGLSYLIAATNNGQQFSASPIGFYFAKLWYFERLYPVVYTVAALERASLVLEGSQTPHEVTR